MMTEKEMWAAKIFKMQVESLVQRLSWVSPKITEDETVISIMSKIDNYIENCKKDIREQRKGARA